MYENTQLAVFIDSANLHYALRPFGEVSMDWSKLRDLLLTEFPDAQLRFYCGVPDRTTEIAPIFRIIDYLKYNGYVVCAKPMTTNERGPHANCDVEIATDMMDFAHRPMYAKKRVMLFSGDGDFALLIDRLNNLYVHTTVVSNEQGEAACSLRLRAAAQQFADLSTFQSCFRDHSGS